MKRPFTSFSRMLRKNQTDAERLLWMRLRAGQMEGSKFRRQHQIGQFIVDFICLEKRLIVELDGGQHAENPGKDVERDEWLNERGFKVIRFWNTDVLQGIEVVLESIRQNLSSPSP